MEMRVEKRNFPLHTPFVITGYTFTELEAVWVTLSDGNHQGRGEACGVYYLGDTQDSMVEQLEAVRSEVEQGATRADIQHLLPAGGARNALDCALWDLECKKAGVSIWQLLELDPHRLTTVATIGIGTPEQMSARAMELAQFRKLKIKLDANQPVEKLRAIRAARPDAELVVDANQGWGGELLAGILPELAELGIAMVEQPIVRGGDEVLSGIDSPIPLGADESLVSLAEYDAVAPFYDVINIKLDKCGGLTEALAIVERAQADGKKIMVGNMTGTSLSMAPSYVVGQFAEFVDIDGPILLSHDIDNGLSYAEGGVVSIPSAELWG
jgi:L-alanine-DL-glutamate epimerase-like enolase superfamily enzyme